MAEAIVRAIERKARELKLSEIPTVEIVIGELRGVELDILRYALDRLVVELLSNEGIRLAKYRITVERASFLCRRCGHRWSLEEVKIDEVVREAMHFLPESVYGFLCCPRCFSRDFDIVGGKELYVRFPR